MLSCDVWPSASTGISVETRMSNGQLFAVCNELSGSRRQSKRMAMSSAAPEGKVFAMSSAAPEDEEAIGKHRYPRWDPNKQWTCACARKEGKARECNELSGSRRQSKRMQ